MYTEIYISWITVVEFDDFKFTWVNNLSHKFCPDTLASPCCLAVACLYESRNSCMLVRQNFAVSFSYNVETAVEFSSSGWLKHFANTFIKESFRSCVLFILSIATRTSLLPWDMKLISLVTDFTQKLTSSKKGNNSTQEKYMWPSSLYFKHSGILFFSAALSAWRIWILFATTYLSLVLLDFIAFAVVV